jgi:3-deoxy-D-arabino-heptulosonate 7-phosphate (DAHP) synthase
MATDALDVWTERRWTEGVQVDQLHALETLSVRTRNNVYEVVVTEPSSGAVMVRGGAHFPDFTPARVCGSTAGGSLLKRAGIYVGLRLEIELEDRRIVTSTVMSIDVIPASHH